MNALDFSLVIVNYNTCVFLQACLSSIYRSEGDVTYEVIVVDNNSSDGSTAMLYDNFPQTQVIANRHNYGFAKACNQGINSSSAKYMVIMNSDIELLPDTLTRIRHFFNVCRPDPRIGLIGCKILNQDGSLQYSIGKFPTIGSTIADFFKPPAQRKYDLRGYDHGHEVDWVTGAFMAVDRQLIQAIGGLDEGYFLYYEEVDWCLQARRNGWKIFYYPQAQVVHKNPHATKNTQDKDVEKIEGIIRRSHLYYYRKNCHFGSFLALTLITLLFLSGKLLLAYVGIRLENNRHGKKLLKKLLVIVWNSFWQLRSNKYHS